MKKNAQPMKELMAYGVFGILTTVVNLMVYQLGLMCQLPYGLANTVAFVLSVLFAFFTNKHYVFKSHQMTWQVVCHEMIRFFAARMGTFAIETSGLWVMITGLGMGQSVPKYAMTVVVIVLNYFLSKKMVFKSHTPCVKEKKVTGL